MICWNCAHGQATALSSTQHPHPQPNGSNLRHPIPVHPARQKPHLAEIRRRRRQSVQMGRKICVCLSRCNPWRDISSGVGNSSAQTVDDHVLVNGRTRKRSAAGGWSEAEVCAEELPLHGRPCMEDNAAASGSTCWQGNALPAKAHSSTYCQARRRNGIYRAVSKRALSWSVWASMVMLSPFWRLMVANGSMSGISLPNASEITFINFA